MFTKENIENFKKLMEKEFKNNPVYIGEIINALENFGNVMGDKISTHKNIKILAKEANYDVIEQDNGQAIIKCSDNI